MSYADQRAFSDRYMPYVKAVIGQRIIDISSFEKDTEEATDLVVLRARDLAIACRVRNFKKCKAHFATTKFEFTVRARTSSNSLTEIHKLASGFGDWMFYGWSHEDLSVLKVPRWMIVDLHAFRYHMIANRRDLERNGAINDNAGYGIPVPGGNCLWGFDVSLFPAEPNILIDCNFWREMTALQQQEVFA